MADGRAGGSAGTATARRGTRWLRGLAVAGVLVVATGGCSYEGPGAWSRLGFPQGISDNAQRVTHLWIGSWIAAMAVGVFVWGLILYAIIVYRRRGNEMPAQTRYNMPIEVLYTVVPMVIVGVLFYFTARDESAELAKPANVQHVDKVIAYQWAWTFVYENAPGGPVYDLGTTSRLPVLWVPKGQSVEYQLVSNDVIHAFWVPAFLFKMDVIPGRLNTTWRTANQIGEYPGRCSELCGLHHSAMLFTLKVVSPADYRQHLRDLRAAGQVGNAVGHLSQTYDPNARLALADGSGS